jgi:RNA polymerase sigma-70 factor (ECF subfamily)
VHPDEISSHSSPAPEKARSADALLVEQVRRGDPEAGHRFFQEQYPGVYRYLLWLTGRPDLAEDLAQETFVRAWRYLDAFDDRAPLGAWLHRIAHREFLRSLRRQTAQASLAEAAEVAEPRAAELTEAVEWRAVLRKLPVEEGEVLLLHYLQDYNCQEIARIVGTPVSTVKYRLLTARAHLQQELGEGDLVYLNEPGMATRQWAWLPLDQMHALEARLSLGGGVRRPPGTSHGAAPGHEADKEKAMERREFLRHAAVGAAGLMLPETEREVVDRRLTQKATLASKGTALSELCEHLRAETGVHLAAGPSVADEKVTLFCEKTPVREVMRQLSRPFGYTWLRSGKEGEYKYELVQDLRSQLLEEELRNRDRNAALLALEQELEKYRPYLSLTPEEILVRAKTAPPAEKKLLENLGGGDDPRSGLGYAPIQMYFRLSRQEMEALRSGQWVAFSTDPRPDDGLLPRFPDAVFQPGERPLPPSVARGILQIWRWERIAPVPGGLGCVGAEDPNGVPFASFPGLRPWLTLTLEQSEPGQYSLKGNSGFRGPYGFLRGEVTLIGVGRSLKVLQPDNEAVNARLAGDLALRPSLSLQPEPSCRSTPIPTASSDSAPEAKVTPADVLETLHRVTGLPIVADAYTRLYRPETVSVRNQSRFAALNVLGDTMRLRWNKEGSWLQFRSTSFYDDCLKEVPNRLLSRWADTRRRHGFLTLDDLVEIAQLSDAQLNGKEMAEGARLCYGLAEWELVQDPWVLTNLRFLAQFTPAQRQEAMTTAGLPFTRMTLVQQQGFLDRALGSRACGLAEGAGLQSLEELAGATLRVDYRQPGWYEWQPAGGLPSLRWVVPLGPPPDGRLLLVPVVRERTPEAALQALRRVDPRIREAVWKAAVRYNPRLEQAPPGEEAQIVPSTLDLTTLYIPGTTIRFMVQFQSSHSQCIASGW